MTSDNARSDIGKDALAVSRVRPAYQQVADQLSDLIMSGSLSPGDKLPSEAELCGVFGVSRSTVREALRVLDSRDLIFTKRGTTGGAFVARVQREQVSGHLEMSLGLLSGSNDLTVNELLEARELLEVPSARLAATRRTNDHVVAMREAITREVNGRGRVDRFRDHRSFHGAVVEASGNVLLSVMAEPVFRVLEARFLSPELSPEYWVDVDRDHRAIADCIETGDGDGAAHAMKEHLRRLQGAYSPPEA